VIKRKVKIMAQDLVKKIERVKTSLENHVARGNRTGGQRSWELIDRYNETKALMIESGQWADWCESQNFCPSHDAYDFFA
jgi:hypothetical protein